MWCFPAQTSPALASLLLVGPKVPRAFAWRCGISQRILFSISEWFGSPIMWIVPRGRASSKASSVSYLSWSNQRLGLTSASSTLVFYWSTNFFSGAQPNELIQEASKALQAVLCCVPLFLVEDTSTVDFVPRISSHGKWFSVVRLISDLGEEFVDSFLKNHVDSLPHLIFTVPHTFLLLFEWGLFPGGCSQSSFHRSNVLLQPSIHLDVCHEVPEVARRV